jgi:hypothetical protein
VLALLSGIKGELAPNSSLHLRAGQVQVWEVVLFK